MREISKLKRQPLLKDLAYEWLESLKRTRRKSTIVKYSNQLSKHIIPRFGNKRINKISNKDINSFANELIVKKNLSQKTTSDIISCMKSIRKYALNNNYNVLYLSDCLYAPTKDKKIQILSIEEERRIIKHLRSNLTNINRGILVCLFTGLRVGELCALKWSDISLKYKEIYVKRTLQRLQDLNPESSKKTFIEISEPKSKSSVRTIPIPDIIYKDIQESKVKEGFFLTGESHHFIEPRTMENHFKKVLKKCSINDSSIHICRHTYATRCVEAGFDIKTLSEILGHSNVTITLNRYVHPSIEQKHKNVMKLSQFLTFDEC